MFTRPTVSTTTRVMPLPFRTVPIVSEKAVSRIIRTKRQETSQERELQLLTPEQFEKRISALDAKELAELFDQVTEKQLLTQIILQISQENFGQLLPKIGSVLSLADLEILSMQLSVEQLQSLIPYMNLDQIDFITSLFCHKDRKKLSLALMHLSEAHKKEYVIRLLAKENLEKSWLSIGDLYVALHTETLKARVVQMAPTLPAELLQAFLIASEQETALFVDMIKRVPAAQVIRLFPTLNSWQMTLTYAVCSVEVLQHLLPITSNAQLQMAARSISDYHLLKSQAITQDQIRIICSEMRNEQREAYLTARMQETSLDLTKFDTSMLLVGMEIRNVRVLLLDRACHLSIQQIALITPILYGKEIQKILPELNEEQHKALFSNLQEEQRTILERILRAEPKHIVEEVQKERIATALLAKEVHEASQHVNQAYQNKELEKAAALQPLLNEIFQKIGQQQNRWSLIKRKIVIIDLAKARFPTNQNFELSSEMRTQFEESQLIFSNLKVLFCGDDNGLRQKLRGLLESVKKSEVYFENTSQARDHAWSAYKSAKALLDRVGPTDMDLDTLVENNISNEEQLKSFLATSQV